MEQRIKKQFQDSAELKLAAADLLTPVITQAAKLLLHAFDHDHRVLSCGNGGSACDAQHLAS